VRVCAWLAAAFARKKKECPPTLDDAHEPAGVASSLPPQYPRLLQSGSEEHQRLPDSPLGGKLKKGCGAREVGSIDPCARMRADRPTPTAPIEQGPEARGKERRGASWRYYHRILRIGSIYRRRPHTAEGRARGSSDREMPDARPSHNPVVLPGRARRRAESTGLDRSS
jgi:hypothetical protein